MRTAPTTSSASTAPSSRSATLPEPVREAVTREVDRLERTGEQSPEHGWIRTWLDSVLELPWGTRTEDDLDVAHARGVLDADHTGLDRREETGCSSTWPCASCGPSAD